MIKSLLREILLFLRLDVTKNLAYDRMSRELIRRYVSSSDNCVDVGAHKGEFLDYFTKQAPQGKHLAFEPIPQFYTDLKRFWKNRVAVYPFALSDTSGRSEFQWVKNAPAYSGLKRRKYAVSNPEIETIDVEMKRLDDFQNPDRPIRFIKIDVEGAEFLVLKGANEVLKKDRPFVLFEFGLGASDFYQNNPKELFQFFDTLDYALFNLKDALQGKEALTLEIFENHYINNSEYYFWAAPK